MSEEYPLRPPSDEEFNRAVAKRMFGKHADQILANLPWSLLIVKRLWKKGEEPWRE